ncbi:T9SS type A sorting domain-containing protein [Winogradskyella eckloniae]|uniref:putative glycoside hydrolase n=1 Tax=Winogradskyella eckloniae TaxID=1089306 RepID=UPI0015662FCC|nr:putative glycoside hydrolase [Winogradskyella eckloniae]NRD20683.1 T9SS type A sorting domain-containing protein [Winogradskyella eckloniae]
MGQKLCNNLKVVVNHLLFFVCWLSYGQVSNLWVELNPNAGHSTQLNEDISINNGTIIQNFTSSNVGCFVLNDANELVYSVTYIEDDLDNDGDNEQVAFDVVIKAYTDATYTYSAEPNASSVTNYGTQTDVTNIDNSWGVMSDFDIDPGESLVFEIDNLMINGLNSNFTYAIGFSAIDLVETNGGRDHTMIFGLGNGLESLEIDSNQSYMFSELSNLFSVTGTGSLTTAPREIAIKALKLKLEINGPDNTIWDVTDYSVFEKGPDFYHDYPEQTVLLPTLPNFSWNKIPRWVAVRSNNALSEEAVTSIAENYQLVMLEKANFQGFEYIEDGIENLASRIKTQNPNLTTLFYYNTRINYFGYEANEEYNSNVASWSTYLDGEIYLFKDLYYWYNHDVEAMRNWWINTCVNMANLDVIDGVFVDKITNPNENGDLYNTNGALANNYVTMLSDLNDQLPSDKLIVGNTLRNEREGGNRALMEIMDGSYIERWDFPSTDQSRADAIAVSIQLMREALQKGKMINFQSSPSYSAIEEEPADPDELLAYTIDNVKFPLAVFLLIVEENAYFSYKTGVNAASNSSDLWDTSFIDEFSYFLGEPLSDPIKNGYIYERSFENLDLWVNIETKETVFNWIDETALSISDIDIKDTVYIFPNPVSHTLSISKRINMATIYNMYGQKVLSFSEYKKEYDVSQLQDGIYIITIKLQNGEKHSIRFVKK